MIKTALIFAAGRGERMMPYTKQIPKPLLEVKGKPLLAYHLQALANAGIQRVIINHAYLGYQIRHFIGNGQAFNLVVDYLPEPSGGLETAGTLAFINKSKLVQDKILLCINADILTDYQAKRLIKLDNNVDAHLILIPKQENLPPPNFGYCSQEKRVLPLPQNYIFSGICYYRMAALNELSIGRYSIRDWLNIKAQQHRLSADVHTGLWQDVGHPRILQALNQHQA